MRANFFIWQLLELPLTNALTSELRNDAGLNCLMTYLFAIDLKANFVFQALVQLLDQVWKVARMQSSYSAEDAIL